MSNFNVGDIVSVKNKWVDTWGITRGKVICVFEKEIKFILLRHDAASHLIGKTFTYSADMFDLIKPVNATVSFFIN